MRVRIEVLAMLVAVSAVLLSACASDKTCKGAGCLDIASGDDTTTADGAGDAALDAQAQPDFEIITGSVCSTGQTNGCVDDRTILACAPDGESWVETPCYDESGDGVCMGGHCTACTPGRKVCDGEDTVLQCDDTGAQYTAVENCNGALTGQICQQGVCTRLCELAIKFSDYMGCEYFAVDLDNAFVQCGGRSGYCDAHGAPFAVVVSNPHPRFPAEISVWQFDESADSPVEVELDREGLPLDTSPLLPGTLRVFYLPRRDVNGTMQGRLAYRVESSIPITAYQFNPLENVDVYSNDASILLPSNVLGRYYFVMTREQSFTQLRSYLTVVAVSPGTTDVVVEVTAHTLVGDESGIGPMEPGDTLNRSLKQYDVLNIETDRIGDDMTGSIVLANKPVAVFGGSEASNAPNTNHCVDNPDYDAEDPASSERVCEWDGRTPCDETADCSSFITCCADHLEHQLFPVKAWGKKYLATKSMNRGEEADNWRIIAMEDGTRVSTLPPQLAIPVLDKGGWFDFESRQDFEIIAEKPIMVGQFLQAEKAPSPGTQPGDAGTGDPAFLLAVPVEQFREDYVFLAPNKYAFDYVSIIAPTDSTVEFDGTPVDAFDSFGTGDYKVARFLIRDGVHTVRADAPVSVLVYGYDQYVSYGYPAGLNLTELNDEPGVQ